MMHSSILSVHNIHCTPACCTAAYHVDTAYITPQHDAQQHSQHTEHMVHTSMMHRSIFSIHIIQNIHCTPFCCSLASSAYTAYGAQNVLHSSMNSVPTIHYTPACCTAAYPAYTAYEAQNRFHSRIQHINTFRSSVHSR